MLLAPLTTPTPPAPQTLGQSIGDAVKDAMAAGLAGTRAELQRELARLQSRRDGIRAAMENVESRPAQAMLQTRLDETNREIAKLQSGLDKLDRQLTTRDGPAQAYAGSAQPPQLPALPLPRFDPTPLVFGVLGILFVAFPLTLAMVRFLWKRASNAPAPALSQEQAHRFDRIEQSVDAIAIEVERISENQRYLTKLLAEPKKQEVGMGSRG
jgi:hypothetical protein